MKAPNRRKHIAESLRTLVRVYTQAMVELENALTVLCRELELDEVQTIGVSLEALRETSHRPDDTHLPVVDRTLLSIRWRGRSCFLGNTLPLKLFERLVRRPNQYVSYADLLNDVWEGPRSFSAIRSVVKVLRQRLCAAEMPDLAAAIDGSVFQCYGLRLDQRR